MRLGERGQADTAADGARVRKVVGSVEAGAQQNSPKGERVSGERAPFPDKGQ